MKKIEEILISLNSLEQENLNESSILSVLWKVAKNA